MDLLDDEMLRLWKSLDQHNVRYIMVGGFATNLHGFSRTTADLDLWIDDTEENRQKLIAALSEMGLSNLESLIDNAIDSRMDNLETSLFLRAGYHDFIKRV